MTTTQPTAEQIFALRDRALNAKNARLAMTCELALGYDATADEGTAMWYLAEHLTQADALQLVSRYIAAR